MEAPIAIIILTVVVFGGFAAAFALIYRMIKHPGQHMSPPAVDPDHPDGYSWNRTARKNEPDDPAEGP